jgi:redox-sensitive bicupin YhaK (pirin superfamily)
VSPVEIIEPRDVPLGGPRAMKVRRTLPARGRSLIGAWCFLDHYGPDEIAETGGMSVAPHPHTGLQTVSWLFAGEIDHRDSAGNLAAVCPGELNLMTAGRGISHTEVSTERTRLLHGVQLWLALPDAHRHVEPDLTHHAPPRTTGDGWAARVFIGSLLGETSPVSTHTPLLGAELHLEPGSTVELVVRDDFEHGVLVDTGVVTLEGAEVRWHQLGYVEPGRDRLTLTANEAPVRLLLLGGEPFGEEIVMWWNFVGRSHEEIVEFREAWQDQITHGGRVVADGRDVAEGRFGNTGHELAPIPAPELPHVRLKSRR